MRNFTGCVACVLMLYDKQQFAQTCTECGGATMFDDKSNYHRLFGELRPVARVKTGMRQSITSQNLCDSWGKYRQNAYIS